MNEHPAWEGIGWVILLPLLLASAFMLAGCGDEAKRVTDADLKRYELAVTNDGSYTLRPDVGDRLEWASTPTGNKWLCRGDDGSWLAPIPVKGQPEVVRCPGDIPSAQRHN